MTSTASPPAAPLAAGGGIRQPVNEPVDPFSALDDLMFVVESLCPTWPEREPFSTGHMLL